MNKRSIEEGRDQIIAHFGEWTAHNFQLVDDVYTIGERITGDEFRLRRVMQIIGDFSKRPLSQLRIVDLACLEGMYSVELARRGATVLAIEGRSANLEKVRFAKDARG
jgi:2-polyprenyl-3-methyl-5-hydroxy-6-metoxy-1,4-benzoquinol methylase